MPRPVRQPTSKELLEAHDRQLIANAHYFTVIKFIGRTGYETGPIIRSELWEREEFPTLRAARDRKAERGTDEYGRPCTIYAVAGGHRNDETGEIDGAQTIFVSDTVPA